MKKRIMSILLALALLCAILPAAAVRANAASTSGYCGANLTWTFDSTSGTLTISGSGKMYNYDYNTTPWYNFGYSIKKITIGNSVTSIGDNAFYECRYLTSVTIPNSVTSIGAAVFYQCNSLTSVTIPSSVTSIGYGAFRSCASLTRITVASGNGYYSNDSYGVLFNKSKTVLIQCPGGIQGNYTIPGSVINIGIGSFWGCSSLTKVIIPDSVTTIGNYAFCFCDSMTNVTIGNSVLSIGDYAFGPCSSLTSVTIPNSVTSIGDYAFCDCDSLTSVTIPESVTSIGDWAFYLCRSLPTVTIPSSVTSIGSNAFASCDSMVIIFVASGNSYYCNDSNGVLFNKNKTTLIQCPGGFKGSYTIPSSVTCISTGSFWGCRSLTKVTIPNSVTNIENYAFPFCSSLTSVTIPDSVTSIGYRAFGSCSSLTSVFIPDSVTWIGEEAFIDCNADLVFYGVAGSYAEEYANENYIPFVALSVPKITTQPKNATVAIGQSATFKVVATGSNLSYQWQYRRAGATSWTNYSGKTEATLTVKGGSNNNGCQYRCVVSNPLGKKNSAAATLTVTTVAKPVITTQPKSVSMALGECMTFSCAATGQGTLTYQWQYKRSGETSWTNWSGKTETILNVVAGSNNNGCRYRCAVTNDGGTTYTDTATLTITSSHECPGAAFTDMPAKGTIEHTAIDWAIRAGVTNGTSATTFSPNRVLTRSQVVTFLWRACGSPEPKTTQNPFTDVKTTDWFYKAVLWAVEQGITNGTSANKFSPNTVCSRSQTLTFLYRQQGSPAVGSVTVPYTDVTAGAFYENAMKWAYANGIDKGVTATTFAPNANCVRVSNVVFLYRAITGLGRLQ